MESLKEGALWHLKPPLKMLGLFGAWHMPQFKHLSIQIIHLLFVIIFVIITLLVTLSGIIGFFRAFQYEREILASHTTLVCMLPMLMANYIYMVLNRNSLDKVLESFQRCYNYAEEMDKKGFEKIFSFWSRIARRLSFFWITCIMYSGVHWFSVPLINRAISIYLNHDNETEISRSLPFIGWYFYDKWSPKYYEVTYFMESIATLVYVYSFGVIDGLILSYLIICCGHLAHLAYCLERMHDVVHVSFSSDKRSQNLYESINKNEKKFSLVTCVRLHQLVYSMFETFNKMMSPLMLAQTIRTFCALCFFSVEFTLIGPGDSKLIILIEYFILYSVQFFLYTWFASEVTKMGNQIANKIYMSDWISSKEEHKKKIILMIQNAQKPLLLKGGPFVIIDLELLIHMFQTAFSIYTLILKMKEKNI